jgi:glucose-6-phosphate 1-epimerase
MNPTLPPGVLLDSGRGGLRRLSIDTGICAAELYLHGAHLCRWQPRSQPHPVLWMSEASRFESGAPIRGGVPICFPWFGPKAGDPSAPVHGVARISAWNLDGVALEADGSVVVRLGLDFSSLASPHVTHNLMLAYELRLGRGLSMALTVTNPADVPATFEVALHTYLAVGDVRQASVAGLEGVTYVDKVDGAKRRTQTEALITIAGETDRLYLDTGAAITLTDPGLGRRIRVEKTGSRSSVVWNPWVAKSRAMADFGDDEWPGMICLETANAADNAVTVPPHASQTMTATISVEAARDSAAA